MKSFKILVAAVVLAAVAAPSALAQEKKGKMSPEQQVTNIEQAVGSLTADQKKKITDIITKANEAMAAVPKEERKEKSGAMNKKRNEDIKSVLTGDQKKKYDEYLASQKKK